MEPLEFLYALISFPMLVALLVAVLLLHLQRTWITPFVRGRVLDNKAVEDVPESMTNTFSFPTVTKESDFPETWWIGKSIWDLEARSIFSHVSIDYSTLLSSY